MVKIIISHKVKDYHQWRPSFDNDLDRRKSYGIKNEQVYRDAKDENYVYISGELDDASSLDHFFNDPALKSKMEEAGVVSEPSILVMNPA